MEKIVIAILLLISELSNIHAQHIDLETQKNVAQDGSGYGARTY